MWEASLVFATDIELEEYRDAAKYFTMCRATLIKENKYLVSSTRGWKSLYILWAEVLNLVYFVKIPQCLISLCVKLLNLSSIWLSDLFSSFYVYIFPYLNVYISIWLSPTLSQLKNGFYFSSF